MRFIVTAVLTFVVTLGLAEIAEASPAGAGRDIRTYSEEQLMEQALLNPETVDQFVLELMRRANLDDN